MPTWHDIGAINDWPENSGREVVVDGRIVAVFRAANEFFAMDGMCAHQGGPLAEGRLEGTIITCPWHGWQYDLRTGRQQITPTICQATFPTRVQGDRILVNLDGE